eukprot:7277912-Karenia_brevis.AAC.1
MMQRYRGSNRNEMDPELLTFRGFYKNILHARCAGHVAADVQDYCHVCLCKRHAGGDNLHHCPFCNLASHQSCLSDAFDVSEMSPQDWSDDLLDAVIRSFSSALHPDDARVTAMLKHLGTTRHVENNLAHMCAWCRAMLEHNCRQHQDAAEMSDIMSDASRDGSDS